MVSLPEGLHGAYLRSELARLIGAYAVREAVRQGTLATFCRGVLVDPNTATTTWTRAACALLLAGPGAAISGFTALELYGCTAAPAGPIDVLSPYHRKLHRRSGIAAHHGRVEAGDVCDLRELRVMEIDHALAEVLCRGNRYEAFACADQVLALAPPAGRAELRATALARMRARPDPRGRKRATVLLSLASGEAESPAESWCMLRLYDAGLPVPQRQYWVLDIEGRELYRLDFAWPELRLAVEYDGYAAHAGRERFDAARAEDLRRRGWTVIRASSADLRDPGPLIAAIRSAMSARGIAA